jgi:hypothetical protein
MYLYIMGRGHSGSTILDIVLGGGSAIESVGELVSGLGRYYASELCSCGQLMKNCSFWSQVRNNFEAKEDDWDEFCRLSRAATDGLRWLPVRLAQQDDPQQRKLAAMTTHLAEAVAAASGKPHMLDSNKETARALFLLRYVPEARIIHLVRDPCRIQQSHFWRLQEGRGFRFRQRQYRVGNVSSAAPLLLLALGWLVGNVLAELGARIAPARVCRIRYEDLCRDPAGTIAAIGDRFGLDVADILAKLEQRKTFEIGHNVGGNPIRHSTTVQLDPGFEQSRPALPRWAGLMTLVLCWPLMHRYGYVHAGRAGVEAAIPAGNGHPSLDITGRRVEV